ncbi:TldD/PmbA family protein [Coprothermobacter platensis]|uniref:TldD/PmbA family protein n=1 Tax=Coprothermobacter platensis TaxID=108819 RepID=UPI0003713F70|nr:metallopeptidase TldD-related protein [Coprothermobacter platensis]
MIDNTLNNIAEKLANNKKADKTLVVAGNQENLLTRFAVNRIHQHVRQENMSVTVVVEKNKRVGIAATSSVKEDRIDELLEKALSNAELSASESTLQLSETGEQQYDMKSRFVEDLIDDHDERARIAANIIDKGVKAGVDSFGLVNAQRQRLIIRNSAGTSIQWESDVGLLKAMYMKDEGSGYQISQFNNPGNFIWEQLSERALQKCLDSQHPEPLEPGKYTVILEPLAVGTLLEEMAMFTFNARAAYQGHSYVWEHRGEQLFPKFMTIYDWGLDDLTALRMPMDFEGYLKKPVQFIEGGVAKDVVFDSRLAQMLNHPNTGHSLPPEAYGYSPIPLNVIMLPGEKSEEQLIKETEHGVLVTMLNYVSSYLDPLTVLATGITRNGTFLIENGKVTKAVNNTRFLQSFVEALQHTTDIGSELMMVGEEMGSTTAPALKIENFNFM